MEIRLLQLKKMRNARDLGGIPAMDGKVIRPGKLIRSGRLFRLPEQTKRALSEMGVTTVVDFRIPCEIEEHPESLPEGVKYRNLPFFTAPDDHFVPEATMRAIAKREGKRIGRQFANIDAYIIACYAKIVWGAEGQAKLREFLKIAAKQRGCLLFHCNSGKDRTGIAAMLLESLLGVSEEDILTDYMASRRFLRGLYTRYRVGIAVVPARMRTKRMVLGLLRIKKKYLQIIMDSIKEEYGTIEDYCRIVLEMTDEEISAMRKKYLIDPKKISG